MDNRPLIFDPCKMAEQLNVKRDDSRDNVPIFSLYCGVYIDVPIFILYCGVYIDPVLRAVVFYGW